MKKFLTYIFTLFLFINSQAQLQLSNKVHNVSVNETPVLPASIKSFVPVEYKGSDDTKSYILNADKTKSFEELKMNTVDQRKNERLIDELKLNMLSTQKAIASLSNDVNNKAKIIELEKKALLKDKATFNGATKDFADSINLTIAISQKDDGIKKLEQEKRDLEDKLKNLAEQFEQNKQSSDVLLKENIRIAKINEILSQSTLAKDGQITRLLKTEKEFIHLKYKTDSTELNLFFNGVKKNVEETKAVLESNMRIFNVDSANLNNALADITKITASTSATDAILTHTLDTLLKQYKPLWEKLNECSKLLELESILPITTIDSLITERRKSVLAAKEVIIKNQKYFAGIYETYKSEYQVIKPRLEAVLAIKKETRQSDNVSILANFTNPLNESGLAVPGFDVLAYNKFTDSNRAVFGAARFFLGAPKSDTNTLNSSTRLFVPEASSLGFMVDFVFGFDRARYTSKKTHEEMAYHTLGINIGLYYLQKELQIDNKENTPYTIGLIQTRMGIEKTIVRNGLAAFATINGIYVGKGMEQYKKQYDDSNKMQWFIEAGLKSYLTLTADNKTNLLMELRFIPVNSFIKKTTQTEDSFIPLIKIGFARSFNF